jgi:hypothetical protein
LKLFNRRTQLLIGKLGEKGTLIEYARIAFDIEMNDKRETNTGTIQVWNLSQEIIGVLDDKDISVILKVGYGEEDPSIIYIGNIIEFKHDYQGVDLITSITLKDGYIPLANRKLSLSFAAGSSSKQIINKIVADLNFIKNDYSDLPDFIYRQGFSFIGSPSQALDIVLARIGYEWTIANNVLIISKNNKTSKTVEAQLLTKETGLLDSPQRIKQKPTKRINGSNVRDAKGLDGWLVKSLILAGLIPKNLIKVESQTATGVFLIKQVRFVGDTHADDWLAEMEVIER